MKERIQNFLVYLSAVKGFSANTAEAYRNDLAQFAEFIRSKFPASNGHFDWKNVSRELVTDYVLSLNERQYAPTTIARKIASLKTFAAY
ncbi:MAG: site-specific integrase, partial [Chloroflexi bacterium]|nr:site-specific integrase [Chloroflexota bacterium]